MRSWHDMMRMTALQRSSGSYRAAILFWTSAHPHCLCHLALVYPSEIEGKTARDRIKAGGDEWLEKKTHARRCLVLGINGTGTWEKGGDWRRYMRGWSSKYAKSRLTVEMMRRKIAEDGHEIIDKATYSKLTKSFLNSGDIIIRGEEAERHLKLTGGYASYLAGGNLAFIRDDASVSDVLEEMYHAKQDRANLFGNISDGEIVVIKREIDAQKYLLKVAEKYKIKKRNQCNKS